jgi:glycerate 2-kinase
MKTSGCFLERIRQQALDIFQAGLNAVDPMEAIFQHVKLRDQKLFIDNQCFDLRQYDRIFVAGAGKAVAPMARGLEDLLGGRITKGALVVKEGHGLGLKHISIFEGGHPVPDEKGVRGTEAVLSLTAEAGKGDLVICLISGGASALLIAPAGGISLADKQEATRLLLACGATIRELNTVRKHLSRSKGGNLARSAYPATLVSLILSDVVGDDPDVIGSGPTIPDASTFQQSEQILRGYSIWNRLPASIRDHLQKGIRGEIEETPKAENVAFRHCGWALVGTNLQAITAAGREAERQGYRPLILSAKLEGEAREAAKVQAAVAKEILSSGNPIPPPACILLGGETTVTLQGKGKGGRCQEYALAAALALEKIGRVVVLSAGTDGTDGPTDAAGAIADGATAGRARAKGLDPVDFLRRNDAYNFFRHLDDLVITGPTRTNVMDLYLMLIGPENGSSG